MIRYGLKCANDHSFDSWFQSSEAFSALQKSGHLSCPECGSSKVEKALMAPKVRPARNVAAAAPAQEGDLTHPEDAKARALAELRKKIESESEYVGLNFAAAARAMHDGETPARAIHGEARTDDAMKLIEDGVPVAPLPFIPKARTN